ncbi:esterase FE4-like [Frieseomelitta varia]|uniref:esterase FE4-like n=1 Tax=Frieseomelitta varia TaxID=561572 RepID=UPI001CB68838|nr:esterase FE4-like [Frieseomelitta varia]
MKLVRTWLTMRKPVVTVQQGKLEGAELKSALGLSYLAFRGIPFAAPPVGDLRFKDPQPPLPWTGIKDISKEQKYIAPQKEELAPFNIIGDEDCLYLNVYTNSLNQSKPVMFWIHGGAFLVGNSSFCESRPDYLLAKDVVVVSANHRLGAFGFLNLGHRVAPGNFAVKDIIAALEWVKENIANFGGDPDNVTIFGASAGGALVHSLLISPRARGLFHKAILHSGTLYCPWTTESTKTRTAYGFKLASILGKDTTDPVEAVEFLRTVPAENIVKAQASILSSEEMKAFTLVYGVDHDEVAENPVLSQPIEQLLANDANVPVIISYSEHEYIMFLKDKSEKTMAEINRYLYTHVNNLRSSMKLEDAEVEKLFEMIKDQYFDGKPVTEETLLNFSKLFSLIYFGIPALTLLKDRVKRTTAPNYICVFSYVGNEKTSTDRLVKRQISGASHVDEIAYLLYLPKCKIENPDPPAIGTKDRITLERITRMWTNFAKTGDPTSVKDEYVNVTWKPATSKELCQLKIGDELQLLPLPQDILFP